MANFCAKCALRLRIGEIDPSSWSYMVYNFIFFADKEFFRFFFAFKQCHFIINVFFKGNKHASLTGKIGNRKK